VHITCGERFWRIVGGGGGCKRLESKTVGPFVNSRLNVCLVCPFPTLSSFLPYQGAYRSLAYRYGFLQYGGELEEDVKVWEAISKGVGKCT
jgi:hypothetical protein